MPRVGVSYRGRPYASMGCLGFLVVGLGYMVVISLVVMAVLVLVLVIVAPLVVLSILILITDGLMRLKSEYRHSMWPPPLIGRMWGFQTVKGMTNRDDSKLNKLRASQGRFGEKLLPITEERPGVPMGPTYKPSKVSTQAALTPNLAALTLIEMLERAEREVTTGRMKVLWVLELLPGVGNVRARRLMEIMDISDSQTLRGLSVLQSNHLVVAMDDPDWAQTVMQTSVASQTPQNSQETMSSETLKRYEAIINDVINDVIELVVPPKEPKPPISAATTTTHNVFGSPASRESKKVTRPTNWVTKTDGLPPSMRWDPNHWRVCKECGSRTRWRNASGDAVCQQCMFKQ